ncbi:secretin receptor isoform X2 [Dermatophagoides farinae]|uniref:secretin receptor isoform X2 n=1 Tax=Dermatophagoides farinae TaxID=6954 RepID=UPI003F6356FF
MATISTGSSSSSSSSSSSDPMCESWWDGIFQWPESKSNTTVQIPCHKIFATTMGNVDADDYERQTLYARRQCGSNGQWGWNNWTNYTDCLNLLAMQEKDSSTTARIQGVVSYIALLLLIASMVSLIISIVIFVSFKPLKCLRIKVHKNLCIALLMNCCLYIIMNLLVNIQKLDISTSLPWFCKSLKALNIYSSMATINWMFVEGFLFHKTLLAPFHQNTRIYLFGYYFIGWIFPAICVLAWALSVEFLSSVGEKLCWEGFGNSNTIFIVSVPMIICVAVNFLFLINIIRILLMKLRADNKSDIVTMKAIKATAFLIPLLGIHHLVVLYNPSTFNRKLVSIYIVINVMFQSVQGIIVSVLYCFTNQEVRTVLNAAWSRRRMSLANPLSSGTNIPPGGVGSNQNKQQQNRLRRQSNGSNSFSSLIVNNNQQQTQQQQQDNRNNNNGHRLPITATTITTSSSRSSSPMMSTGRFFNNNNNNNNHLKPPPQSSSKHSSSSTMIIRSNENGNNQIIVDNDNNIVKHTDL